MTREMLGSVAAARQNDLDWITKTIDVIVCFVLCFVFIVFGGGYQTNWSKSYESCYMTRNVLGKQNGKANKSKVEKPFLISLAFITRQLS